ncbi:M23 family metallopeptidase [Microbacterium oleivorans]|uniref:M23 family metallopeptidase n=1 Tax=Microbacterium oleivorans TaxID=273677 RepID=A0A4R5YFP4_9MICO|nr:M23 family metallopeptidase [Microbacterium oleivorans]TDL43605.1 M23 family metallopeptidase [Microbacterium oleivorans]
MPRYFWEYPITGDTKRHATRGVGPATDYDTPTGTPVHMPISGKVTKGWLSDTGHYIDIENSTYKIRLCHLRAPGKTGWRLWRTVVAYSGATGNVTGPHVHGYVIVKKTGRRVSMTEWLRDYVNKGKVSKLPYNTRKFLGVK